MGEGLKSFLNRIGSGKHNEKGPYITYSNRCYGICQFIEFSQFCKLLVTMTTREMTEVERLLLDAHVHSAQKRKFYHEHKFEWLVNNHLLDTESRQQQQVDGKP